MASRRLLLGAVSVVLWMLLMLFVYQVYVSRYSYATTSVKRAEKLEVSSNFYTKSTKLVVEKVSSSTVICNNTPTIIRQESPPVPAAVDCPNATIHHVPCPSNSNNTYDSCVGVGTLLDHSRCPLSKAFKVFFYNVHFPSLFLLESPTLVGSVQALLTNHASWANTVDEACIFLAVVGPLGSSLSAQKLQERVSSLPHWGASGANHLLVDLGVSSTLDDINTGSAVVANNGAVSNSCPGVLNLNIPPFVNSFTSLPNIFDTPRRHLLYFETPSKQVDGALLAYKDSAHLLRTFKFQVAIGCAVDEKTYEYERALGFCRPIQERFDQCLDSTFHLVLGSRFLLEGPAAMYVYLLESLRCGSVPVVIGIDRLPFDQVIDWHRAVVRLPTLPPPNILSSMLSSIRPQVIMDYRRQGRFLVNTYFVDQEHIVYTSVALLRSLYYHPPPPSPDFVARTIKLRDVATAMPPSPRFIDNFSMVQSSNMWNSPPGAFYMYPVTPYAPPYDPDMFHMPTSHEMQSSGTTGHIQGKEFRAQLRGNYPAEGFTVVALTYRRTGHLPSFLSNFKGCPFLSKIVLVWNNEDDPSGDISWPDIGVPVEVVIVGRNSLNNRFLPYSNIETEAVLALDDDQSVPFNQLELAFRVWRENRDRIVGWYDRTAIWRSEDPQWHYVWNPSCQTSMTLTGAAMFHKYYLYLYSYWMPQAARDMVDSQMNGEDMAMNFLIAYISRKPPIKIGLKSDLHSCKECQSSISLTQGHLNHRKECINALVKIWGHSTLLRTQFRAESLLESSKCSL